MRLAVLEELFVGFVRTRRLVRHFHKHAVLEPVARTTSGDHLPPSLVQDLLTASTCELDALLESLGTTPEGLTEPQAEAARTRAGFNEVAFDKPLPWWLHLWHCYKTPFNLLLTVLTAVSYLTEDYKATVVIGSMIVLATLIRFVQEARSSTAADKLKAMVSNTATVKRRDSSSGDRGTSGTSARHVELPIRMLVPGDVVMFSAGDMIPADCRLLSTKDLFVNQAALTGESLPVEKYVQPTRREAGSLFERDNLLFTGTNVVSGAATAVVLATGKQTYFGALAHHVTAMDPTPTQFQAGINKVAWILIRFMLVMVPLVLLINGFTKHDWTQALLFALSVAVGMTPEMLPMIVTSTLAKGAVDLSRKKVIVKRLDAIQNFGAMNVLCTDKTGTLTQDKVALARHTDAWGQASDKVLELAYLNSYYQTGLKNLLDVAVLKQAEVQQFTASGSFQLVDEIPFDFQRRRMSVIVTGPDQSHTLICKGAVEETLQVCSLVRHGDMEEPLTDDVLAQIRKVTASLNQDGLRVVAVAIRDLPADKVDYRVSDEAGLSLVGYVAFLDPPKESAAPALKALAQHGVAVKVLTGDNDLVTSRICRDVGLFPKDVLLGSDVERMTDPELAHAIQMHDVFAKLTPSHKERIVRMLKAEGNVVGFIGDGINDAPALRAADIGISVDTAVDIAKEAADIILLEKSLMVLNEGVLEGRITFANMLKYIRMSASSNFGNVISVLIASAALPFLPMLPMHLLLQNLLYDISQIAVPFDRVDDELLREPQSWNAGGLGRFMVFFGPISSIFDIITFLVMWFVFAANTPQQQTLFQSGWFVASLCTQILVVHLVRTPKIPFLQSRASMPLLAMTAAILAVGIFIPMGPYADYFKLESLPLAYFPILAAILLGYMAVVQVMKGLYARRFGWQ